MGKKKQEIQTVLVESEPLEQWESREDKRAAQSMQYHDKDIRFSARIHALGAANAISNRGYGYDYVFDTDSNGNKVELSMQDKNDQILAETLRVAEKVLVWIRSTE